MTLYEITLGCTQLSYSKVVISIDIDETNVDASGIVRRIINQAERLINNESFNNVLAYAIRFLTDLGLLT